MRIEIRRAHPEEADTLTEIAHAAKRHWKYPESWIQQWQTDLTITREFISDSRGLCGHYQWQSRRLLRAGDDGFARRNRTHVDQT